MSEKPEKIWVDSDCPEDSWSDDYEFLGPEWVEYIRADLAKPSEWISVDDRLPEEMLRVLLVTNPRSEIGIGRMDEDSWCDDYHGYVSVTHWQPLPPPPTRETP